LQRTVSYYFLFFFSSRRRHTRFSRDWSSDVCSSDLDFRKAQDAARQEQMEKEQARADAAAQAEMDRMGSEAERNRADAYNKVKRSEERRVGKECRSRGGP